MVVASSGCCGSNRWPHRDSCREGLMGNHDLGKGKQTEAHYLSTGRPILPMWKGWSIGDGPDGLLN